MALLSLPGFIGGLMEAIQRYDADFPSMAVQPSRDGADSYDYEARSIESGLGTLEELPKEKIDSAKKAIYGRLNAAVTYEANRRLPNAICSYQRAGNDALRLTWYSARVLIQERVIWLRQTNEELGKPVELIWDYARLAEAYALLGDAEKTQKTLKNCDDIAKTLRGMPEDFKPYHRAASILQN